MPRRKVRPRKRGSRQDGPTLRSRRTQAGTAVAYAKFNGRMVSFGRADDPAARVRFARLKAEWEANGRRLPEHDRAADATIEDLCDAYLAHCETYYRRPDGTPTGRADNILPAIRVLLELYRDLPSKEFDAVALDTLRQRLIATKRKRKKKSAPPVARYTRRTVNSMVTMIRAAFRWGASPEGRRIVPPSVVADLSMLRPLELGRCDARESTPRQPVAEADVRKTLPHLPRRVAALLEVQLVCGARIGELVQLRTRDVDMTGAVWVFRPPRHKNAHRGKPREIDLGRQAQRLLKRWVKLDRDAYWFSPAEEVAEQLAERSAARRTPRWPSHMRRNEEKRAECPTRPPGEIYDSNVIGRALLRACKRAGVQPWSTHQLRHAALTRIRKEFGLEAAQAVGGHGSLPMTELYTHTAARELARRVAAELG